jgi:hypothetical protein
LKQSGREDNESTGTSKKGKNNKKVNSLFQRGDGTGNRLGERRSPDDPSDKGTGLESKGWWWYLLLSSWGFETGDERKKVKRERVDIMNKYFTKQDEKFAQMMLLKYLGNALDVGKSVMEDIDSTKNKDKRLRFLASGMIAFACTVINAEKFNLLKKEKETQ